MRIRKDTKWVKAVNRCGANGCRWIATQRTISSTCAKSHSERWHTTWDKQQRWSDNKITHLICCVTKNPQREKCGQTVLISKTFWRGNIQHREKHVFIFNSRSPIVNEGLVLSKSFWYAAEKHQHVTSPLTAPAAQTKPSHLSHRSYHPVFHLSQKERHSDTWENQRYLFFVCGFELYLMKLNKLVVFVWLNHCK